MLVLTLSRPCPTISGALRPSPPPLRPPRIAEHQQAPSKSGGRRVASRRAARTRPARSKGRNRPRSQGTRARTGRHAAHALAGARRGGCQSHHRRRHPHIASAPSEVVSTAIHHQLRRPLRPRIGHRLPHFTSRACQSLVISTRTGRRAPFTCQRRRPLARPPSCWAAGGGRAAPAGQVAAAAPAAAQAG